MFMGISLRVCFSCKQAANMIKSREVKERTEGAAMAGIVRRVVDYIGRQGVRYTAARLWEKVTDRVTGGYDRLWREHIAANADQLAWQRVHQPKAGRISVVIPVYNTDVGMLNALADSLLAQTYEDWEAVLYDGSTVEATITAVQHLAELDGRFHVTHAVNEGLAGNTNRGIGIASGEWIALCDHDDLLTPDALWRAAECIVREQPDVVYTDEDRVSEDGSRFTDPHFKPDYCPDDLCAVNYICHLLVMRKSLLVRTGGLDPAFDGSQDHELTLRLTEYTDRIAHVPYICYHWRRVGNSMSHLHLDKCIDASRRAVEAHNRRIGWPCTATVENGLLRLNYEISGTPRVSVIAPQPVTQDWPDAVHVPLGQTGNMAKDINRAVESSAGEYLMIVMPGVQVTDQHLIRELLMHAQRDGVGCVTATMTDRSGRITHAGYTVSRSGAACRDRGMRPADGGWHRLAAQVHQVSAVSPACVMVRRDRFVPLDEAYQGPLAMVDACLRMTTVQGLQHVCTPYAQAVCTDRTLLLDDSDTAPQEQARFTAAWADYHDPCYSVWYSAEKGDHSLKVGKRSKR